MAENMGGKRLVSASGEKKVNGKLPAIIAGTICAVLVVGYLGLCFAASGNKVWPNTSVLGVDVSGATPEGADEKVRMAMESRWQGDPIGFVRDGQVVETLERGLYLEPVDVAGTLRQVQGSGFLTRGGRYLASLVGKGTDVTVPLDWTAQGQEKVEGAIASLSRMLGVSGNDTTWTVGDTDVTFTKGYTAARVDTGDLLSGVKDALLSGSGAVQVTVEEAPPAEPDFQAIRDALYAEPADAYLDRESKEVVESVTGKDLDIEAARLALAATAEGKVCRVPLDLTEPALTTEVFNDLLFRDVLGEAATYVSGTADRIQNVGNAAEFVSGTVVFPGEEFSFNEKCSPYSMDNGYGKATAYVNGLSVDTVAGGICQASSTLYWATLKANLETVERNAHRYEPSYIKGGLDATVYGDYGESGGLDFRFKNSTAHPIQIEEYVDKSRYIHAVIRGTDETGIHGEPYSANRVVTQAYKTIYQADASVPQGVIKKDSERTGYTGVTIDTYQKLVDRDGNTLSESKLYTSKYRVRDEVLLFNPADLELWGIDPYTGIRDPEKAVTPASGSAEPALEPVIGPGTGETTDPGASIPPIDEEPVTPPESGGDPVMPPAAETSAPVAETQAPDEQTLPMVPTPDPAPTSESAVPAEETLPVPGTLSEGPNFG